MKDVAKNKPAVTPECEDAAEAGGGVSRPLKLLDFEAGRVSLWFPEQQRTGGNSIKNHICTRCRI